MVKAALAASVLAAVVCGCSSGGSDAPAAPARSGPCQRTLPVAHAPFAGRGFNYGNRSIGVALWPRGRLVAGPLPGGGEFAHVNPDGSIDAKLGWWRGRPGWLTITGERLDATVPPLRAHIPAGYGVSGFQPSGLTFPTPGCWLIMGNVGRGGLAFVVLVVAPRAHQA